MKKFLVYLCMSVFVLIFLFLIYLGFSTIKERSEIKKYNNNVIGFSKVDVQTIKNKIGNDESFFFIYW